MKPVVLKEFSELGNDLNEFPEFLAMSSRASIHNFSDAFEIYIHGEMTPEGIFKQNVARFILWLALAVKGDYKVVVGKRGPANIYQNMQNWVGSNLEIYRQAKRYYQEAILTLKNLDPN